MNNENSESDSSDVPIVLGQQIADARNAETKWRASGGGGSSPLPDTEYDFWRGDLDLIAPTTNPLDDELRRVCNQYAVADSDERSKLRHSISMDQFYTLINFAKRSAVFGIREAKADFVTGGLTASAYSHPFVLAQQFLQVSVQTNTMITTANSLRFSS